MAKSPAFNFYSSDFLVGTMFMSNEQVGAYIRLMCYQHQYGHLDSKQVLSITDDELVLSKFTIDEDGKYYNDRLEAEVTKKNKYCESRLNNLKGKKAKNTDMSSHMDNHMEDHMENEIEIEKEKVIINKELINYINNNIMINNSIEFEKAIKLIDIYKEDEIKRAVDISTGKSFNYFYKVLTNPINKKNDKPEWIDKDIQKVTISDDELEELENMFKEFK